MVVSKIDMIMLIFKARSKTRNTQKFLKSKITLSELRKRVAWLLIFTKTLLFFGHICFCVFLSIRAFSAFSAFSTRPDFYKQFFDLLKV